MANRQRDPYTAFKFTVAIDGINIAGFSEVSGLQAETETEDFREGGVNDFVHKFAKVTKYTNLTLKHGIVENDDLLQWYLRVLKGDIERKQVIVFLSDREIARGREWQWVFSDAYPVKWNGSDLNATGNNVFVESVELAHHGMKPTLG